MGTAGAHARALVEFVDIYPTLVDLAGLPLPNHLEGLSFKPVLERPDRPWKTAAFSQYPRSNGGRNLMGYSMRTERHRFTVWVERGNLAQVEAVELYDHQADPQENQNLAAEPGQQPLVERLMTQWRGGWRGALPR
jgi:arylsulfatase A-like enzyme